MIEHIKDRKMSGFMLSIGTGMALETIINTTDPVYDPVRVVPNKLHKNNYYKYFMVNIITLMRNLLSSLPVRLSQLKIVDTDELSYALIQEIEIIGELLRTDSPGTQMYLYVNDYSTFTRLYPDRVRVNSTDLQKRMESVTEQIINKVISRYKGKIHHTHNYPLLKASTALMMTHTPVDLLTPGVMDLNLLESHTGAVLTKKEFYKKLFKIPDFDMSVLPLSIYTLYIMGDSATFKPHSMKIRKYIHEIATDLHWNAFTTDAAILNSVKKLDDKLVFNLIDNLPKP